MKSKEFQDNYQIKGWLKECEDSIFDYLNTSNFNQVIHEDYWDFGVIGNSTLYEEEDPEDTITFHVRPPAEIFILANQRGKIDTVYRSFTFTARQAYQKWGKNSGQKVLELMEAQKVEETVKFLHIVLPREERDIRKKDARNMPFGSLYIEPTSKKILSEGGYEEFPFFIGRCYKVSDSEYAYSPASIALADIKMLNTMSRDILEAAQKILHPPIILPHDGYLLPFKTSPKAINYKLSGDKDDKVETLKLDREINLTLEMGNQRRSSIQNAFFVDLFLMLASLPEKTRTATEIAERVNERMLILGPILGRLMHEKLDPIITRTFNILMRNGKIPPPPEMLQGHEYKVIYISPLAKAQRASEIRSVNDLVMAVKSMAEVDTSVIDNIDSDKIVKRVAEISNTGDILRSDDEIVAIREQRAKQQQQQQMIEALPKAGSGVKALTEAEQIAKGEK
uniref:Putative head tail connector protein n=1 Tax=viral metagenome TaxID=1070528 RepID=A0A6M3K496_9ZZZZ